MNPPSSFEAGRKNQKTSWATAVVLRILKIEIEWGKREWKRIAIKASIFLKKKGVVDKDISDYLNM